MSDEVQEKGYRVPHYLRGAPKEQMGCIASGQEAMSKPAPKAFTWDDARDVASLVRDSLLMLIKGLERKFDIGKK